MLPLHPRLVHFPIALLVLGAAALIIGQWRRPAWLWQWGLISLGGGWLLTVPAMITGLIDKSALSADSPAVRTADQHTTAMFITWGLYGLALYWAYRWRHDMEREGRRYKMAVLLVAATVILVIASDLGGQLVYRYGVGVQYMVR